MWCYENIQNIKHKEADKNHFQFEFKIIVKLNDGIVIIVDKLQVLTSNVIIGSVVSTSVT